MGLCALNLYDSIFKVYVIVFFLKVIKYRNVLFEDIDFFPVKTFIGPCLVVCITDTNGSSFSLLSFKYVTLCHKSSIYLSSIHLLSMSSIFSLIYLMIDMFYVYV